MVKSHSEVPLVDLEGSPGFPLLNFEGGHESRFPGSRDPGVLVLVTNDEKSLYFTDTQIPKK